MSHQTGIKSNPALRQLMAEAKMRGNQTRLFKVVINTTTEELELATVSGQQPSTLAGAKGTWEADFEATVRKAVTANEPCYLFFRMDSTDDSGERLVEKSLFVNCQLKTDTFFFCCTVFLFIQATTTGPSSSTRPSTATSARRCSTRRPSRR